MKEFRSIRRKLLFNSLVINGGVFLVVGLLVFFALINLSSRFTSVSEEQLAVSKQNLKQLHDDNITKIRQYFEVSMEKKGKSMIDRDAATVGAMADENSFSSLRDFLKKNFSKDPEMLVATFFIQKKEGLSAIQYVSGKHKTGLELPINYNFKGKVWEAFDKTESPITVPDPTIPEILKLNKITTLSHEIEIADRNGVIAKKHVFDCIIPFKKGTQTSFLRYVFSLDAMEAAIHAEEEKLQEKLARLEKFNEEMAQKRHRITLSSLNWTFLFLVLSALVVFGAMYSISQAFSSRLTTPVIELTKVAQNMAQGNYRQEIHVQSDDEIGVLANTFGEMSRAITQRDEELAAINKNLEALVVERTTQLTAEIKKVSELKISQMELEQKALEKDLALTGAVQALLLPKENVVESKHIHFTALYQSATQSGGDWWWYDNLPDGSVLILLGDVTGHGAGSAMVTAAVASCYRTLRSRNEISDVSTTLKTINAYLAELCGDLYGMTMSAVLINPQKKELRWWNAGAPPLVIINSEGKLDVPVNPGCCMGSTQNFELGEKTIHLEAGSRVCLYTDGAYEFTAQNGRQFGISKLRRLLVEFAKEPLQEARMKVISTLEANRKNPTFEDDVTFVLLDLLS